MHNIIGRRTQRWIAGGLLMMVAGLSQAQYLWLNEQGHKVYSDTPPPSSIPAKNILKTPRAANAGALRAEAETGKPAATPADKPAPSLADKNIEFKKRAAEKAEQDKKDAADAAQKEAQRQSCESARSYKRSLDSGQRMGSVDQNGERGYMTDEQRNDAGARANKILEGCK